MLSHTFRQHAEIIMMDDSLVVMRMLLMFHDRFQAGRNHMKVQIVNELNKKWQVEQHTQFSIQNKVINSRSRDLVINATGSGFAMLDVSYSYALAVKNFVDDFKIQIEVSKTSLESEKVMALRVCVNENEEHKQQDSDEIKQFPDDETTAVEIEFPENYIYDSKSFDLLQDFKIKDFYIRRGKTFIKLTFEKLEDIYECINFRILKDLNSAGSKHPTVRVYQSGKQSVSYYTAREYMLKYKK